MVLGHAATPLLRPRHPAGGVPGAGRPARTRSRAQTAATRVRGGEAIICDKGYAGKEFAAACAERFDATVLRPSRKNETDHLHLSSIRQRIESVFWTLKDRLGLERHRARTLTGIRARIAATLLALAAGV